MADRFCERTARTMTGADLAQDLIALGAAFAAQRTDAPEHFAMVRRNSELTERGLLDIADPARAAAHLSVLVVATTIDRRLPQALLDREGPPSGVVFRYHDVSERTAARSIREA